MAEVLASAVFVTAAFASPLFLPLVFVRPAMFVTEAYVKPVTTIGSPVVATAAFASPMMGAFGTPACVTAGSSWEAGIKSCLHQASAPFVTAAIANPITWLRYLQVQYS